MSNEIIVVARQFIRMILAYNQGEVRPFTAEEMALFPKIVSLAGFKFKAVVLGKLLGHYLDDGNNVTVRTYPVNIVCPLKVQGEGGVDNYLATGWLDCVFQIVLSFIMENKRRVKIFRAVVAEIENSVPFLPIRLTPKGDFLRENHPGIIASGFKHSNNGHSDREYFVSHIRDEDVFDGRVGVHAECGAWMDRRKATETYDVIVCRAGHLEVTIPSTIKTYGELRQSLLRFQESNVLALNR